MEFDNPWEWFVPHTCVSENYAASPFDLGVDRDGDAIIHYRGIVGTIPLDAAKEDIQEKFGEVNDD